MEKEINLQFVNCRENGEPFDPSGFVLPYEITKKVIAIIDPNAVIHNPGRTEAPV